MPPPNLKYLYVYCVSIYLAFSIGSIGVLFSLASIGESNQMIQISLMSNITTAVFNVMSKSWQENHVLGKGLLIRNIIFLLVLGLTLVI